MQNLKINGTPTPYWCVVVKKWNSLIYDGNSYQLLGCITLSEMDEEVREIVGKVDSIELYMNYTNMLCDEYSFKTAHDSALSLLTHNQITLTTETKAVVVKQKL